jgi:hypothetical protein
MVFENYDEDKKPCALINSHVLVSFNTTFYQVSRRQRRQRPSFALFCSHCALRFGLCCLRFAHVPQVCFLIHWCRHLLIHSRAPTGEAAATRYTACSSLLSWPALSFAAPATRKRCSPRALVTVLNYVPRQLLLHPSEGRFAFWVLFYCLQSETPSFGFLVLTPALTLLQISCYITGVSLFVTILLIGKHLFIAVNQYH